MKRRICSYNMAAVPEDGYVVTDDGGEMGSAHETDNSVRLRILLAIKSITYRSPIHDKNAVGALL
jgi:hypothetical protein